MRAVTTGATGLCEGDCLVVNGCHCCVSPSGSLVPEDEEVLAKRFDGSDGEMTSGMRRALAGTYSHDA